MVNSHMRIFSRRLVDVAFVTLFSTGFAAMAGGAGVDLSGRDMAHSKYKGRDLRGANLRKADLTMADFSATDLRGADLAGARLDRIDLRDADLRGSVGWATADFGFGIDARSANFSGADLRGAKVVGTYFEKADFSRANLIGATLSGRFHGALFDGASLAGTLMLGAGGVELISEDLRRRGAIVTGKDLAAAVKSGRDFSNAHLDGAQLQDIDLTGVKLVGAYLHSANLDRALLDGANLKGAKLYWASAKGTRFDDADLTGAHFDNVRAEGASFVGAKFVNATLWGSRLSGAELRKADLTGANLSYANLTSTDLAGAHLDNVIVTAAILDGLCGLPPQTNHDLRKRAARWRYDLAMAVNDFLQNYSTPLHVTLTPAAILLGLTGLCVSSRRAPFAVLVGINLAAVIPLLSAFVFALLGGSPTAQMSVPALWHAWFRLWPVMMLALAALFFGSLAMGSYYVVRYVIRPPRNRPLLLLSCVLLTVANCFFALSLQCWTYHGLTFFETVDKAAKPGIKYLEAFPGQRLKPGSNASAGENMSDEAVSEIKQKLTDAGGLKVIAYFSIEYGSLEDLAKTLRDA
jgi:uncharacterized protein YjbI with pentapeptide repeats